jgi:protein-disulfide isomerase
MLRLLVNEKDNIAGEASAAITLVEYGDYQCPHCGHAYPIIKDIQEKMGDSLRFVFRNFPLNELHPQAFMAAVATEAAARQNAFWAMHDIVFENQQSLNSDNIMDYAKAIDLDVNQFSSDLQDAALRQKVETDFESGIMSGVNGTPTFFINGSRYNGSWEENELLKVLNTLLLKNSY